MTKPDQTMNLNKLLVATFAVAALLITGAVSLALLANAEDLPPRPFDPPTAAEAEQAAEVALEDPRVREELGDNFILTGVALRTDKRPGLSPGDHPRLFDVWFYDYDTDRVVWVIMDPAQARVDDLVDIPTPFQPPLAAAEAEHATNLALAVESIASRLTAEPPSTTAGLVHGEGTACPTHRCALISFQTDDPRFLDFFILVNLSQDRVERVVDDGDRMGAILQ